MIVLDAVDRVARARHVATAAAAVRRGDLVVVPTESAYALATDAFSPRGTGALREAKGTGSSVPLPILVPAATTVAGIARQVPLAARDLMTAFWPGSLTLLLPAGTTLAWDHPAGAPVAVRMPVHPVLLDLLRLTGPTAVTSANAAGLEPPQSVDEVVDQLGDVAACALDAGPCPSGDPSTIVDCTGSTPVVVRAGAVSLDALREIVPDIELGAQVASP